MANYWRWQSSKGSADTRPKALPTVRKSLGLLSIGQALIMLQPQDQEERIVDGSSITRPARRHQGRLRLDPCDERQDSEVNFPASS